MKLAGISQAILVTPYNPLILTDGSCLSRQFYGNYLDGSTSLSHNILSTAHLSEATQKIDQLVWLQQEAVDASLVAEGRAFRDEFDSFLESLSPSLNTVPPNGQRVLSVQSETSNKGYELVYRTATAALLSVSDATALTIDTLLPRFWRSTLLPTLPVQNVQPGAASLDAVVELTHSIKFDPVIAELVESISVPQMQNDIAFLTGENPVSGIVSRHSFADGSRIAAQWLKERIEATGASCDLWSFLAGFSPNVICRYPSFSNSSETVLISAHYDSRGSFGSTRAPGGDDDGSGVTALLAIARTIARKKVKFYNRVELVAFAGEEQGLLGSRAYARYLRQTGAKLAFAVQSDMLAYRAPGEPLQLGIPDIIGTPAVASLVSNISALYSPELEVGLTPACCSDHQSFIEQGFPAIQLFERNGPIIDPMYHNSGDISKRPGYDFDQLRSIAKVQLATILHAAGYSITRE